MTKGVKEFLAVAFPKILGGVALILINILLLRQLDPEMYAVYSLCITMILVADGVLGAAFDQAVLRLAPSYRETDHNYSLLIEKTSMILKLGVISLVAMGMSLLASDLGEFLFHHKGMEPMIYITALAIVMTLMLRSGLLHHQIDGRFSYYGLLDLMHISIKFGGVLILIAAAFASPFRIVFFFALAPTLSFLLFLSLSGSRILSAVGEMSKAAKDVLGYIKWYLLTFFLGTFINKIDVFVLTALASIEDVGIFSAALAYTIIPELFGTYLAVLLTPKIMPKYTKKQFFPLYRNVQLGLFALALFIYSVVVLLLPFAQTMLLPESFMASSELIPVLLLGSLASMVTFPLTLSFVMFIRPRLLIMIDLLAAPITIALYILLTPEYGVMAVAWVTAISRLAKASLIQGLAWIWARNH